MTMKLCVVLGVMLVLLVAWTHAVPHPNDCKFLCKPSPFQMCAKNHNGNHLTFPSSCHMDEYNCVHIQDYKFVGKGKCLT